MVARGGDVSELLATSREHPELHWSRSKGLCGPDAVLSRTELPCQGQLVRLLTGCTAYSSGK